MKLYQCHKQVRAAKIISIDSDNKCTFESGGSISLSSDFITKHCPQPGGYIVRYVGGYMSYSPAKAFEEGYTEVGVNENNLK